MPVVDRYGHFGCVARLVGDNDSLLAVCRREDKAAVFVKRDLCAVYGDGIHIFLGDRNRLCCTIGFAGFNAGDNGDCCVQHDAVCVNVGNVSAGIGQFCINNILVIGIDTERCGVRCEGHAVKLRFGKLFSRQQIFDRYRLTAVVGCGDRHRLRVLKEQPEGDVVEERFPTVLADFNFARGLFAVFPQRLDCDVSGDGHGIVHSIFRITDLPRLELLSFGRNKLALRQIIRAAVQYLLSGHCGGDLLGQILRLGAAVRVKRDGMLVALFKRCGYGDVFLRLGEGIGIVSNRNGGGDTVNGQRAEHIALVGGDGEHNKLVLKEQRLAVLGGFCGIYHRYTAVCAIRYRQRVARRARNRHGYLGFSKLRLIRMQHDIRTRQVKRSVHGKALLPL